MQNIVRGFAVDLVRPRRYNYSQQPLQDYLLLSPYAHCEIKKLSNQRSQQLETLLITNINKNTDSCIIYAHGLGSNKLEVLPIAKYFLKQGYDICAFDFSASGRSQGDMTSYGILEKEDLMAIIKNIEQTKKYSHLILWGRSMGAVAVVLAQAQLQHSKVDCLILDSPFSSFQKIAVEIAARKSFIPQFMVAMLMEPLKTYFADHFPVNPFKIDLQQALSCIETKTMLIYSPNDSVVHHSHAHQIIKHCRRNPVEVQIEEDHNMQRSKSTLQKTLKFVRDCGYQLQRRALSKNKGISVASKDKENKGRESVRSSSKIKLTQLSGSKITERAIRTIASLNESIQYCKRAETEISPVRCKIGGINSVLQNRMIEARLCSGGNKQNKPSLNMLRRNRFRM